MLEINKKRYKKTMEFFRQNKTWFLSLEIIYKWLPLVIFIAYPIMLVCVWMFMSEKLLKVLFVPAGVFVLVTALRKLINEQRPYEKYEVPSLFNKTTVGKSMPSRHTASAFIISMAVMYVRFDTGITFLLISALIGASRVFAGVHYVRDVLAGAGISIFCGIVFFF